MVSDDFPGGDTGASVDDMVPGSALEILGGDISLIVDVVSIHRIKAAFARDQIPVLDFKCGDQFLDLVCGASLVR